MLKNGPQANLISHNFEYSFQGSQKPSPTKKELHKIAKPQETPTYITDRYQILNPMFGTSSTQCVEISPPRFGYLGVVMVKPLGMRRQPYKRFQQKLYVFIHPRDVEKSQQQFALKLDIISIQTNGFHSNL